MAFSYCPGRNIVYITGANNLLEVLSPLIPGDVDITLLHVVNINICIKSVTMDLKYLISSSNRIAIEMDKTFYLISLL